MPITRDSLAPIPTSYATCSIGYKPEHTLPQKLDAIASAGFKQIELSFPDIQSFAALHLRHEVEAEDYDSLCTVCGVIKAMCEAKSLQVLMLQPFANFEGWPEGSDERKEVFTRARGWIRLMEAAGAGILQVGSTDTPTRKIGLDRKRFVADLKELGGLLAEKGFKLAYENWCWSSHAPTWRDVWEIVEEIDIANVGLCLDTFQTAGYEWADPTTLSGLVEDDARDQKFKESMESLSRTIPAEKIFLLQISDAYKPRVAFSREADESGTRPRGRWSHDFRPLPFDGGYLPVVQVAQAVLNTGFRGPFSYEVFDSGPEGTGKMYELDEFARGAMTCHEKLLDACAG